MSKFRIGDRISFSGPITYCGGTIVSMPRDDGRQQVSWDKPYVWNKEITWANVSNPVFSMLKAFVPPRVDINKPLELEDGTPCALDSKNTAGSPYVWVNVLCKPSVWSYALRWDARSWAYWPGNGDFHGVSGPKQLRLRNVAEPVTAELPYTQAQLMDTAMCMWEACLEGPKPLTGCCNAFRGQHGVAELRDIIQQWAPVIETEWRAIPEKDRYATCFDWEFVPTWLQTRVDWDLTGLTYPKLRDASAA